MLNLSNPNATGVQIFRSPQFGEIRTAGTWEQPLFCLADVCRALGLSAKGTNQRLTKEVISNYPLKTNGGIQLAIFVNEDGLYDVILDSRKPEAKAFRKWITSEVLPVIRKTGMYATRQAAEKLAGQYILITGADDNLYLLSILKAMREFIIEEASGHICTELRLVEKIEAARTLFPEQKKWTEKHNVKIQ
jgi:prophage antirepressor-like protein